MDTFANGITLLDQSNSAGDKTQHASLGRNVGIDLAKSLAAFGVVTLHFVGPQAGILNAGGYLLASFAIPVFIMCNGYFVLNKKSISWHYAIKKTFRLFIQVVLWCVVNWVLFALARHSLGAWGILTPLHDLLACALQRGDDGILWYLWMLASLELCAPLVVAVQKKFGWRPLVIFLGCLCLCVDIASVATESSGGISLQSAVPQPLRVWTWVFYFCLGGMLGDHDQRARNLDRGILPPVIMFAIGAGGVLTWGLCVRWCLWSMDKAEYLYDDPTVMLFSVGLLVICDVGCAEWGNHRAAHAIAIIGGASLGIYTLQVPMRAILRHFYELGDPVVNLVLVPCVYAFLLGLTLLMKKVPVLRNLVMLNSISKTRHGT